MSQSISQVRSNLTEQLREREAEIAKIRSILAYVNSVEKMTEPDEPQKPFVPKVTVKTVAVKTVAADADDKPKARKTQKQQPSRPEPKATAEAPKRVRRTRAERLADGKAARLAKRESEAVPSRADQILSLTRKGMSPKEVAEQLNANISYVYLVRRKHLQAA